MMPRYGLRKGDSGPWLTAPRRIMTQGVTTMDPTHARKWTKENGAYVFRKRHRDELQGFIVRPIITEPANA
jgi:hypothetical protein